VRVQVPPPAPRFAGTVPADRELLIHHAEQFDNGAVFKRLGFLADTRLHDKKLADECRARLTHSYAKLDPALRAKGGWPKIKLDLIADERQVLPSIRHEVVHPYSDKSSLQLEL
jgi:hypothetical protein